MSLQNVIIVVLIVICALLLFALFSSKPVIEPAVQQNAQPPVVVPPAPEGEPPVPPRQPITEEAVNKLYLGLAYEEVEALVGIGSDERESEYQRGIDGYTSPHTVVWHTWLNPDDTRVRLGFVDGKLEKKEFYRRDGEIITNEVKLEDLQ